MAECMANGGRVLVNLALRELCAVEGYAAYLRTNHWQNMRALAFTTYGRRCTLGVECDGPLDVHHRTYVNLGNEQAEDLEVLCRKHHQMKHDTYEKFVREQGEQQFRRDRLEKEKEEDEKADE